MLFFTLQQPQNLPLDRLIGREKQANPRGPNLSKSDFANAKLCLKLLQPPYALFFRRLYRSCGRLEGRPAREMQIEIVSFIMLDSNSTYENDYVCVH